MENQAKPASVRCSACGRSSPAEKLRRGRCHDCYDIWVRTKPVGVGACCAACGERRRATLRQFELHRMWLVLCHNCTARADQLQPTPRSVDGLRLRLTRERRWGDRRAEAVGVARARLGNERRDDDRRVSARNIFDATEFVIELEAEFASPLEGLETADDREITDIRRLIEPSDL